MLSNLSTVIEKDGLQPLRSKKFYSNLVLEQIKMMFTLSLGDLITTLMVDFFTQISVMPSPLKTHSTQMSWLKGTVNTCTQASLPSLILRKTPGCSSSTVLRYILKMS